MFPQVLPHTTRKICWPILALAVITAACSSKDKSSSSQADSSQVADTSATASAQSTQNTGAAATNAQQQAPAPPPAPGAPGESAASNVPVMIPLSQDLTFKGTVNGHMAWARRGDQFVCGRQGATAFVATPMVGYIARGTFAHGDTDSTVYKLSINIANGYVGVGAYHNQGLKLFGTPTHAVPLTITLWPDSANGTHYTNPPGAMASVTVDLDQKSGTITADLVSKAGGKVHFGGTWRCPPAPQPTTPGGP